MGISNFGDHDGHFTRLLALQEYGHQMDSCFNYFEPGFPHKIIPPKHLPTVDRHSHFGGVALDSEYFNFIVPFELFGALVLGDGCFVFLLSVLIVHVWVQFACLFLADLEICLYEFDFKVGMAYRIKQLLFFSGANLLIVC